MSANPWDFNKATDTLGKLKDAKASYLDEFERIHNLIDSREWEEIIEPMNLKDHSLETLIKRPARATSGVWWDLKKPDCWGEAGAGVRSYIENYDITEQFEQLDFKFNNFRANLPLDTAQQTLLDDIQTNKENFTFLEFAQKIDELTSLTKIEAEAQKAYDAAYNENFKSTNSTSAAAAAGISAREEVERDYGTVYGFGITESQELAGLVGQINKKLNSIEDYTITDFKEKYEEAVIALSLPEVLAEVERQASLTKEDLAKAAAALLFGGGLIGVAATLASVKAARRKLAEDARASIQKSIAEEIKEELEEAFADNIAYTQQCILLSFMGNLVAAKKQRDRNFGKTSLPYRGETKTTNAPIRMLGEPFGFVNRLVVEPSQKRFFSIPNQVLSSLVPHIRFFKVEADGQGKDVETEVTFDSNGRNSVYNSKNVFRPQRGHGVGMKSFNFSYDGTDPFSAKKMIAAKLSIYASTFDELLREREDSKGNQFKYAELALKTGGIGINGKSLSEVERENLEKLNFRLKATLGWALPNEKNKFFSKLDDELKDAIYDSFITIYLTPTMHNFSFDETGATTFDIEYLAYIEDAFAQSSYNIFSSIVKEKESRDAVFQYFEELECDLKSGSNPKFKDFRKADETILSEINASAFQEIMSNLQEKEKIYYLNFDKESIQKLNRNPADASVIFPPPTTDFSKAINFASAISDAADDSTGVVDADEALLSIVAVSQDNNSVPYFYFGDLIEVVMGLIEVDLLRGSVNLESSTYFTKILQKKGGIGRFDQTQIKKKVVGQKTKNLKNKLEQFRKMRVILGPMEMFTPLKTDGTILCSIADIPISVSYFFDFMSDKVLAKDIISYPFSKFIKDMINDIIGNFLNSDSCTRVDNSQKLKLNSTTVCAYNQNKHGDVSEGGTCLDDITYAILRGKKYEKGKPPLTLSGKRGVDSDLLTIERMMSYFVFTVGRRSPVSNYIGNKGRDESVGIFHYMIGQDSGFVKNITLEKTTTTGLKEVRFEQEGYNGLEQLREVYNAKIETFLNVQTFPGVYVYIEPGGFAPNTTEDLTRFGIGGYCMVTKTEHSIAPGVADTTLHTVWVASKEGDRSKNNKLLAGKKIKKRVRQPEGKEKIKKCLAGPHHLGLLATGRGQYKGMDAKQRASLADEIINSGAYSMGVEDDGD